MFLHQRRPPGGEPLIVAVRLSGITYYPVDGGTLACTYNHVQLRPGAWDPPVGVGMGRAWGGVELKRAAASLHAPPGASSNHGPTDPGPIRVYFGRPDATDESAFTVPYEVNGKTKQWRFRLTATGLELAEQGAGSE